MVDKFEWINSISPLRYFVVTCGCQSVNLLRHISGHAHSLILLVKVVQVAVQNFDKQFHRHGGIHARICHTQGSLQALQDALAIAIKLTQEGLDLVTRKTAARADSPSLDPPRARESQHTTRDD